MIATRGDLDERTVAQLTRCVEAGDDAMGGAAMADGHVGYSLNIGGVVAYRGQVSPSGVGYDIGCGNKAVMTDLMTRDVPVARAMNEVVRRVSFGMGRNNDEPVDDAVLDDIRSAAFEPQRKLYDLAARQLGTVGAGNHYVDLFDDEYGRLWVGVHFGSRGFGHKTASGFLSLAQGKLFEDRGKDGEMDSPPVLFDVDSMIGESYVYAMELAGAYAYAGRNAVVNTVLDVLGAKSIYEVHNHHNYAWREQHFGEFVWVVRKGATPCWPGQQGFIGSTMGEESLIVEGVESDSGPELFYSTVHGAGRAMSRTEAAGKMANVNECNVRDCGFTVGAKQYRAAARDAGKEGSREFSLCPDHPRAGMRRLRKRVREGKIDFRAVQAEVALAGIELRGAAADEAPGAYKRLRQVIAAHDDTLRIVHRLRPVGVAMAGPDTVDQFKD